MNSIVSLFMIFFVVQFVFLFAQINPIITLCILLAYVLYANKKRQEVYTKQKTSTNTTKKTTSYSDHEIIDVEYKETRLD